METLTEFQKTLLKEVLVITGNNDDERVIAAAVSRVIGNHLGEIKDRASWPFLRNLLKRQAKKAIDKHMGAPKQEQLL